MSIQEYWQCEQCGSIGQGQPAHTESYPTHEGETTLYFCEGCTQ